MHKLPEYTKYHNEKNIALLDNSSIAFMQQLKRLGFALETLLSDYDAILIPSWVLEEVCDSQYREDYINDLVDYAFPIYSISEGKYSGFMREEEINLYKIVQAAISQVAELRKYLRQNVTRDDLLDLDDSSFWLPQMHQNWPIPGPQTASGRTKKKNAGEISLTILAEVFSWYYPMIDSLTVLTQDSDAYSFVSHAQTILKKEFAGKVPFTVTFKSNDFMLCQLFRSGNIQLSDIARLRKDSRKVTYTRQRPDQSVALIVEQLDNPAFEQLIQDQSTQIIF